MDSDNEFVHTRMIYVKNGDERFNYIVERTYDCSNLDEMGNIDVLSKANFTGVLTIYTPEYKAIVRCYFENNEIVGEPVIAEAFKGSTSRVKGAQGNLGRLGDDDGEETMFGGMLAGATCYGNGSVGRMYSNLWYLNNSGRYSTFYTGANSDNSSDHHHGGGGSTSPDPLPLPLPSPDTPIESIEEYLDCFDRSLPATLTIYVDQALANTDNAFWLDAGHCFIGITQNGNESIFGFHPKDGAKEEGPNTSILGDDSGEEFDVSITIEISADQLSRALFCAHNYPNVYDLSDFNCTDFAINMAAKGGLTLPDTYKSWPNGGGSCPGQLGQDIRKMTLPAGVTPNYSGGDAPNNIKTCK